MKSIVVDVGGGLGTSALPLVRAFPQLEVIVQDLEDVIADTRKVRWASEQHVVNLSQWLRCGTSVLLRERSHLRVSNRQYLCVKTHSHFPSARLLQAPAPCQGGLRLFVEANPPRLVRRVLHEDSASSPSGL